MGTRPELIAPAPYGPAGGAAAMAKLLDAGRPTAVICSSDLMALGAISAAQRRGLVGAAGPVAWSASTTSRWRRTARPR